MPTPSPAARSRGGLIVGRDLDTRRHVLLSDEARRTHLHVIGSTGTGKSKFLEWMIREDILARRGLCLIDPHGRLYRDVVTWLAATRELKRPVILFNPADDEYTTGYNPLRRSAKDLAHQVDEMVRACARVWGAEGMDTTPLLKKCLRLIFTALAERHLTLLEAQHLVNPEALPLRTFLTAPLKGTLLGDQWDHYNRPANQRQFADEFGSSISRLVEFLAAPRLRRILGQAEHTLDLRRIMDQGGILLVNLSTGGRLSRDNARLLGTLLVNDLFITATEREKGARPFYCYIDECHYYLNEDIGHILDEGRKFGLHLTLAHQHLAQLKKAGEDIYKSVLTDAKTKVIFGGLDPEDARILAELVYMGEFDPDEIKLEIQRTFEHHHLEWLTVRGESHGVAAGSTYTAGTTTTRPLHFPPSPGGGSVADTSSTTDIHTVTDTETQSTAPFLIPEEDKELSSVQFRSLEEQLYKAMATMICQPTQQALFKVLTANTRIIRTPDVSEPAVREERIRRYETARYNEAPSSLSTTAAEAALAQQQAALLLQVERFDVPTPKPVHSRQPVYDNPITIKPGRTRTTVSKPGGKTRQARPVHAEPKADPK